jgi:hypothetical protein
MEIRLSDQTLTVRIECASRYEQRLICSAIADLLDPRPAVTVEPAPDAEAPHDCKYKEALKQYSDADNWERQTWTGPGSYGYSVADRTLGDEAVN